ncbi:MAG TPA: hypothetical protein VF137_02005 [Candidatus Dormibacteraeota bacterium]
MQPLIVVVAIVVIVLVALLVAVTARSRRSLPSTRPLPSNLIEAYESRLPEIERLFVAQPREAVAAAKLLVDDMLNRMGYPVRMENEERVRDLRGRHRQLGEMYKRATSIKAEPTTEKLRQSLKEYLEMARRLLDEAAGVEHDHGGHRRELA